MKIIILLLTITAGLPKSSALDPALDGTSECESILNDEDCMKLRDAAKDDGLTDTDIIHGLQDAIQQKKVTYSKVVEYLDAVFICKIFLSQPMCTQLQAIAQSRNIPFHQVELMMHASRAKGMRKPQQLYAQVIKYLGQYGTKDEAFHDTDDVHDTGVHDIHDVKYVTACTDLIPKEKCDELSKMASKLKLDPSDVTKGLTDSTFQGVHGIDDIYKTVTEYLNSQVECFSILDTERCGTIAMIAIKEKIPFREVERKLKKTQAGGVTNKQKLYQMAIDYLNNSEDETLQASNTQIEVARQVNDESSGCQKVLKEKDCVELARLAQIFGVSSEVVDAAVVDAHDLQGVMKTSVIMRKAQQFLEDRSFCHFVMTIKMCANLQSLSAVDGVPFHDVRMYINELYMNRGVKAGKRLYAMSKTFIKGASDVTNDETADCKAEHGKNTCMVLLKSVMQCLSLKIFSWKGGLAPNDVTESLKNTCLSGGGRTNLYKRTIAVLRCRIYCKVGKEDKACSGIYTCKSKQLKEKPKDLVIGIDGESWENGGMGMMGK